jgi:hypothetical protein
MRSLCDAGHDLVVGQTFRLKTLFVLVGLRAHGLTARDIVIGAEDPEEFHRIRIGLHEDYEPTSTIELDDALGKLSRYEASLANALTHTLSLLHSIQASRLVASDDLGSRGQ